MSEEFDIFKNLEDLRKTNLLDQLKTLDSAKTTELNESQDIDNDDFDFGALIDNNKKSPPKRQRKKDKVVTPEKKLKKNEKTRRSSSSTDGSLSPTMPLLENLSKQVEEMPVSRRTRRHFDITKIVEEPKQPENIEPPSSKGRGRGRGRGLGRGRGRGRGNGNGNANSGESARTSLNGQNSSTESSESAHTLTSRSSSNEISDYQNTFAGLVESYLQQNQRTNARVMRARRKIMAEIAARSTQVDSIDLVSSPFPRVEGYIDLDSDTEVAPRTTRSKMKKDELFTFNSSKNKKTTEVSANISFDEDNPEISIKVNWKGKPEGFQLRKYQKFSSIFKELAEREKTDIDHLVFNLNNRIIMPDDTPDSINYKIFQFIDGRVLSNRFNSPMGATAASKKRDANKITLKIQSDKWKHPIQVDMMKTDKFRILYIKCAEELKVGIDQLKLSFDGELLDMNETAADLDLEGGEAIDFRLKN